MKRLHPFDSSVIKTSGDVFNIDPFVTYVNPSNNDKHRLQTRYMKVINDNETKDDPSGQDNQSQTYYTEYQYQKEFESIQLIGLVVFSMNTLMPRPNCSMEKLQTQ